MNVIRKTLFFLGIAALMLCFPLTAAAEDENVQTSPTINSAMAPAAYLRAPGTERARARLSETVVTAPTTAAFGYVFEHVANFVLRDGRSHLLSFCLLRC